MTKIFSIAYRNTSLIDKLLRFLTPYGATPWPCHTEGYVQGSLIETSNNKKKYDKVNYDSLRFQIISFQVMP